MATMTAEERAAWAIAAKQDLPVDQVKRIARSLGSSREVKPFIPRGKKGTRAEVKPRSDRRFTPTSKFEKEYPWNG